MFWEWHRGYENSMYMYVEKGFAKVPCVAQEVRSKYFHFSTRGGFARFMDITSWRPFTSFNRSPRAETKMSRKMFTFVRTITQVTCAMSGSDVVYQMMGKDGLSDPSAFFETGAWDSERTKWMGITGL